MISRDNLTRGRFASNFYPLIIVSVAMGQLLFVPLAHPGLPQVPDALLHFLPQAQHDLRLKFGDTPLRMAAGWIS